MVKKTKSKQRLDKFYNLAKQQGYRSRAAFKLIQLNRKYNFLNTCNTLVDLCAAPGGWLQVASSVMPQGSTIIGMDLVTIKPIPHCRTFQQDITSPGCIQLLQKELHGQKADVFLHDGAPNVGASWIKDAYSQNELVLVSLKLATTFLAKGGMFITKVFRSADYNSLMWVFNKFFEKVEATKPVASRFVSAEIFVVCIGFQAPAYVDEKLFDVKHVFKDSEVDLAAAQVQREITSVAKLLEKRRHRTGYADDAPLTVYKALPFEEFLSTENPFPLFLEYNRIELTPQQTERYMKLAKPPADIDELLSDIQVLGKREILQLLKWKSKIKHAIWKSKKQDSVVAEPQEDVEEAEVEEVEEADEDVEEDEEEDLQFEDEVAVEEQKEDSDVYEDLVEMQKEILNKQTETHQRTELKDLRKQRDKRQRSEKKMERGAGAFGVESDEELFNINKHKQALKKASFVDVAELDQSNKVKPKALKFKDQDELDKNLEMIYEDRQARKLAMQNREQEKRQEKERLKRGEEYYEEVEDDQYACERPEPRKPAKQIAKEIKQTMAHRFFDRDTFASIKEHLDGHVETPFDNPLKAIKKKEKEKEKLKVTKPGKQNSDDSEEVDRPTQRANAGIVQRQVQNDLFDLDFYVDEQKARSSKRIKTNEVISQEPFPNEEEKIRLYDLNTPLSDMKKRREKLRKQREKLDKQKQKDKLETDPNKGDFEIVPAKSFDDYSIDELAATRALAKRMFRKKARDSIIENSFNRHTIEDEDAPQWFRDDEQKHRYKIDPITKEEFLAEKEKLLAINARVPKKVMEYKIRKWKKTQKKMRKAAQKAQSVFDQDGVDDRIKLKQVQKIYKKEKAQLNQEKDKKYIVSRKGITGKGANKKARGVRMVDARLKKDKRATKVQKIRKTNIRKKRHVQRHKAKKSKN